MATTIQPSLELSSPRLTTNKSLQLDLVSTSPASKTPFSGPRLLNHPPNLLLLKPKGHGYMRCNHPRCDADPMHEILQTAYTILPNILNQTVLRHVLRQQELKPIQSRQRTYPAIPNQTHQIDQLIKSSPIPSASSLLTPTYLSSPPKPPKAYRKPISRITHIPNNKSWNH